MSAGNTAFDYIVVGAGTAGCVLAARLSENPQNRVCLIEAGGSERHPYIRIPAAVAAAIMSPRFGWGLKSTPQKALNDREVPLPRGKVIGGCGSINGMAYYRGPALDYDDWAAEGLKDWDYASLLPYFLRSEDNKDYTDSPYHGTGGPMGVSFPMDQPNRLCESFNEAMADLGFSYCHDFNVAEPEGYGYRQGSIVNGRRVSTASAYLRPVFNRSNLTVMTGTMARRIVVENGRATGVEIHSALGQKVLRAEAEVIVSNGAFHSPHLLLNSGIGETAHLEDVGVQPVHHLPGVGRNLHDHPASFIALDMSDPTSYGLSWKALPRDLWNGLEYLFAKKGPLSSNLFETNAYIKSQPDLDRPDMQVVFQPARRNTKLFPIPLGHGFAISIVCLYPKSRGSVRLQSANPQSAPVIDPALGSDDYDLNTLVRGMRLAHDIATNKAFAQYQATLRQAEVFKDDDSLNSYVTDTLATVHHPGGTCRMGTNEHAVVDDQLKVRGLDGLRVADASVYPTIPGANTNASVVAIAEKCADMVLGIPAPEPLAHLR